MIKIIVTLLQKQSPAKFLQISSAYLPIPIKHKEIEFEIPRHNPLVNFGTNGILQFSQNLHLPLLTFIQIVDLPKILPLYHTLPVVYWYVIHCFPPNIFDDLETTVAFLGRRGQKGTG